ncbi:hypothetical protein CsSME_00002749 [Camellia sinensis var. sinensis]
MAVSTLPIVVTPKPHALQTCNPKLSLTFKPSNATYSCSSFRCSSSLNSNPPPNNVRRVLDIVGLGLLASSVVALLPLDASATRIEYYATVAEPPCELNFARSGLGYCDLAVGSGEVAPLGELVNVSNFTHQDTLNFNLFLFAIGICDIHTLFLSFFLFYCKTIIFSDSFACLCILLATIIV